MIKKLYYNIISKYRQLSIEKGNERSSNVQRPTTDIDVNKRHMDNTKHHYKLKLNEIYLTIVNQIPSVYIEYVKWAIILFIPIISVLYLISRILHTALVHSVHNSH